MVAKVVEANAGGEELFRVDSLQSPVTGYMSIAPLGLVAGLRKSFSVAFATFAEAVAGGKDDCS
jgi:hypothetical protein